MKVDRQGDIQGQGHPKRDTVEWMIPVLWPLKVITLPLRGRGAIDLDAKFPHGFGVQDALQRRRVHQKNFFFL
jgi:hypothetical protein